MIHFSTGFCCPDIDVLDEKIVEWNFHKPCNLIKLSEWFDENTLSKLQPHLLGEHPNTYTYTKRLAEILCRDEYEKGFPVCIVRPSIIIPAYQEPLVGWIDSLNGPAGNNCFQNKLFPIIFSFKLRFDDWRSKGSHSLNAGRC